MVDENAALGRVVVADFAEARVLDRLLMYERRIESSLYRTMAQLRNEREARQAREAATREEDSSLHRGLPANQESATPARLASFGANPVREGVSSVEKITPHGVTTSPATPAQLASFGANRVPEGAASVAKITPYGVTTSRATVAKLGSFGANRVPEGAPSAAKITPYGVATSLGSLSGQALAVAGNHGQDAHATKTPDGATTNGGRITPDGVTTNPAEERLCETNPIVDGMPAGLG